jgi:hypothetical protein
MIEFQISPFRLGAARVTVTAGHNLEDALAQYGRLDDCIGCSTAAAAPPWTPNGTIERILNTFSPLAKHDPTIRPGSAPSSVFRGRGYWTDVDIDLDAQRLHSVKMPATLVGAQRLLAVNDLRGESAARPVVAIGLWALFAHPIVRAGARFSGARDGLTAEIALAVHPDRYVIIESDRANGLTYAVTTADPIAADLVVLALRQGRARFRGAGPWEDPLVQAATELDLGARTYDQIDIDAVVSPTLSSEQQERAAESLRSAAESIGVERGA